MFKQVSFTCLIALWATALCAQGAPQTLSSALPLGESIMDKYIGATGGMAAYKALKNTVIKGAMDVPAMGIKANLTIYASEPNLTLQEMEIPGLGKMLEGVDGKVAWGFSSMTGPTIKTGKIAEAALNEAQFRAEDWKSKYVKVETVALETVEGEECYKVLLTPKAGEPLINHYSKSSGLLIKSETSSDTEMGKITIEILFKDYRKVGEMLMPFKMDQKGAGQAMTIAITDIKTNADLPKSTFEPPAEVKALMNK
ncbi:MAG: hypothetical protein FWG12_04810 [Holophagaceae bacterium]|nr:hypothetical protein [Holophagaceae bacterium]